MKLDADGKLIQLDFEGMRCVECALTRREHRELPGHVEKHDFNPDAPPKPATRKRRRR